MLALTVVTPVCAQTQALKTVRYTIFLDNGVVAGEQIVERPTLDTIKVHFDFKENGRGPTLDEVIKIGPDLTMLDYKVTGSAEMGGAVDERFSRRGGVAEWSVKAERGTQRVRGPAFYVPVDSSLEVNSLMITALSAMPSARSNRFSSVVLPLPRNPVIIDTGVRAAERSGSNRLICFSLVRPR